MADSTFSNREKSKQFDQEIREMISVLTNRLTSLQHAQKVGGSSHQNKGEDEDDDGPTTRIVTLAGNNMGASMRGEMDEKAVEDSEALKTYVNSNFQAVNNSIMFGGSYSSNDPGVHMEVVDSVGPHAQQNAKKKKKGKKKEKDSSTSDHKIDHSD